MLYKITTYKYKAESWTSKTHCWRVYWQDCKATYYGKPRKGKKLTYQEWSADLGVQEEIFKLKVEP